MIDPKQFTECVIQPTLKYLADHAGIPYSYEATVLLLMTAGHESKFGTYLRQIKGPAKGPFQMEPATHDSLWVNYLEYRPDKAEAFNDLVDMVHTPVDQLETNLMYATAMARLQYYIQPEALPSRGDYDTLNDFIYALAKYAKKYYNTDLGKATVEDYAEAVKGIL